MGTHHSAAFHARDTLLCKTGTPPHTHQSQADKTQGPLTPVSLTDLGLKGQVPLRWKANLPTGPHLLNVKGLILAERTSTAKDWSALGGWAVELCTANSSVTCHRKGAPKEPEEEMREGKKKSHQPPPRPEPSRLLLWAWTTQANMLCPDRSSQMWWVFG